MASPTNPMPQEKLTHQLNRMYQGLRALEIDETPSNDDWRVCSDAVNLLETFIEMGVCQDESGLLSDAIHALAAAGQRNLKGLPIRLDGKGIMAVRAILEDYATVISTVSHRCAVACHRRTEKRLQEILRGKRRSHDVTVGNRKANAKSPLKA